MKNPSGIKTLANGKFQARYFAGFDSQGKRQYPSQTFDKQSEAIKWRNQQIGIKLTTGAGVIENPDLTVADYCAQYLANKRGQVRPKTLENYGKNIRHYIVPQIGAIKLSRLRPIHLATMQSNLLKKLAGSTVHLVQSVLWDVLEQAVTLQLITSNPLRGLARPQKTKGDYHALTVEESISYMQACERVPQRYGLALIFALQTGLRPEELCGLKWSNIELTQASARTPAQGIVKVRQVVQEMGDGNWHWSEPKTKNGRRSVCFSVALYQRLQDHRRWQLERRLRFGRTWNAEDLVFPSQLGTPLKQQRLRDRHAAVLTVAGLPLNLRVYDLRHAFVTLSLVAGVDPKTVSREAGHASVAFTLDHYGHVLEEQYEEAGLKRAELFAQRGKVLAK